MSNPILRSKRSSSPSSSCSQPRQYPPHIPAEEPLPGTGKTYITWDEEGIREHDKTRGTRMQILEPPTPYHYGEALDEVECVDDMGGAISEEAGFSAFNHGPSSGTMLGGNKNKRSMDEAEMVIEEGESKAHGDKSGTAYECKGSAATDTVAANWEALHAKLALHQRRVEQIAEGHASDEETEGTRSSAAVAALMSDRHVTSLVFDHLDGAGAEGDADAAEAKQRAFKAKRDKHYDEFKAIQALKMRKFDDEDEEEDD